MFITTMFIRIKIVSILLLSVAFWAGTCGVVSAAGVCPSEHERALLELINEARENPLAVALSMGLDPDEIVKDLPELENILTDGLPAVSFNRDLYDAACAHTEDMFARGYYSHDSPDGLGFDERIQDSGYQAVTCGESLGMLGFVNFIDPGDAVGVLFESMFRDELDPSRSEKRNILGPDFQEIGISLATGTMQVEGIALNAYLVTCDFASTGVSLIELELCQLINQARENPLAVATSMGLDPDQILENIPELGEILTGGIAPLRFSRNLHESARLHALDMLENNYYSHISLDGRTIDDRVAETGYCSLVAGEVMGLSATVDFEESREAAVRLFERIFRHELVPGCADRTILDPEMQDVGVSFNASSPGGEGVSGLLNDYYSRLVVADFAASVVAQSPSLIGRVYRDMDGDGMYDPGEGLPGICVSVQQGTDVVLSLFTGPAGDFSASLEPGVYRISADIEDVVFEHEIEMADENRAVEFMINAAPDEQ